MVVLQVHNRYARPSGEESVVAAQRAVLEANGHKVLHFERNSDEIRSYRELLKAFCAGIYNPISASQMRMLLRACQPDVVHIHNLYPLISPSILPECSKANIPVVMTVHNYRLTCPTGLHMTRGQICQQCRRGKEYWCIARNCEGGFFRSFGYALRTYAARRLRLFSDNVAIYAPLTKFHRDRLIYDGISPWRINVIPNMVSIDVGKAAPTCGSYIAFAGRISQEKGIQTFLAAARKCRDIPFRIAGNYERMTHVTQEAPDNCKFMGHLSDAELTEFYRSAQVFVAPSIWFETFCLSVAEAMVFGKPTICSDIGALKEIVDEGVTGLLFQPGNADDLAEKIQYLWNRPAVCRQMGQAGKEKALREYSSQKHYDKLIAAYQKAIELKTYCRLRETSSK